MFGRNQYMFSLGEEIGLARRGFTSSSHASNWITILLYEIFMKKKN